MTASPKPPLARKTTGQSLNPLSETVQELEETRRILEGIETAALSGVARMLAETAESLARTARELREMSPDEWMTSRSSSPSSSAGAPEGRCARPIFARRAAAR